MHDKNYTLMLVEKKEQEKGFVLKTCVLKTKAEVFFLVCAMDLL